MELYMMLTSVDWISVVAGMMTPFEYCTPEECDEGGCSEGCYLCCWANAGDIIECCY